MTEVEAIRGDHLKVGDDLINLRVQLLDAGDPFNLDTYAVTMKMRAVGSDTLTVDNVATIESADRGIVSYDWDSTETDTVGTYEVEFHVEDNSDSTVVFPSRGYFNIRIQEKLE